MEIEWKVHPVWGEGYGYEDAWGTPVVVEARTHGEAEAKGREILEKELGLPADWYQALRSDGKPWWTAA